MTKKLLIGARVEFIGNPEKLCYTRGNTLKKGMTGIVRDTLDKPYRNMVLVEFGRCVRPLFPGRDGGDTMMLHCGDYAVKF